MTLCVVEEVCQRIAVQMAGFQKDRHTCSLSFTEVGERLGGIRKVFFLYLLAQQSFRLGQVGGDDTCQRKQLST